MSSNSTNQRRTTQRKRLYNNEVNKDKGVYKFTFQECHEVIIMGANPADIDYDLQKIRENAKFERSRNIDDPNSLKTRSSRNPPINDVSVLDWSGHDSDILPKLLSYEGSYDETLQEYISLRAKRNDLLADSRFVKENIFKELQYYTDINQKYLQLISHLDPKVSQLIKNLNHRDPSLSSIYPDGNYYPPDHCVISMISYEDGSRVYTPYGFGKIIKSTITNGFNMSTVKLDFGTVTLLTHLIVPASSVESPRPTKNYNCVKESITNETVDYYYTAFNFNLPTEKRLVYSNVIDDGSKTLTLYNSKEKIDTRYGEWEDIKLEYQKLSSESKRLKNTIDELTTSSSLLENHQELLNKKINNFREQLIIEKQKHCDLIEKLNSSNRIEDISHLNRRNEEIEQEIFDGSYNGISDEDINPEESNNNDINNSDFQNLSKNNHINESNESPIAKKRKKNSDDSLADDNEDERFPRRTKKRRSR